MECMYRHLMDGRTTVAQALRLAMLHLLRRRVDEPSDNGDWRRPVFWAGFLVVGATTRLRCTAPSAHPPPQVMFRVWEYDRLLLALPASLARSDARSFPRARSLSCVFIKRVVISEGQSVSCRERRFLVCVFSNTRWLYMAASQRH